MRDDFQTLFDLLPIGAYRSSPEGRILRANLALARINGYDTEAEHLASVADIAVGWYVEAGRREVFKQLIERDGRVIAFVSQVHRRKSGGLAWVSENAHLVRDAAGRVDYYEGTVEDITERVQAQQALEASRQELAHMIDLVPGVVYKYRFRHGGPRQFTYVGRSVERMFGIPPEQVMAEPDLILRLRHPDDRDRVERTVSEALGTREPLDIEYRIVLDDGRVRWIRMTSAHAPDEQGLQVRVGMIFDVTEHKRAEEALRDTSELWKSALEQTGDGVWDWDLSSGREQLSVQGLALYGYAPGELPDDPATLDGLTHPDDIPTMRRAREEHFAGLTPAYVNEHRIRCKDGRWKWVLSRGVVMRRDAHGRPLRMVGTHTDIDAVKHAEQLRHERDRAAAADLAKSQFLSRVSHELRTPLNAVLGFAQLLQMTEDTLPPETRSGYVRHIVEGGQHLLALVDEVLDLSAAQTGELRVQSASMPLMPVVRTVLQLFAGAAQSAEVQLAAPAADAALPPDIQADERRCRQILANLVSNAIKYNRAGGRVEVAWRADGATVYLDVSDTGPGLTESQRARLFRPFDRLDADRSLVQGTGLGLALSQQLAQAMGGRIEVASRVGQGSTFTLCLPRAGAQPRSEGRA